MEEVVREGAVGRMNDGGVVVRVDFNRDLLF